MKKMVAILLLCQVSPLFWKGAGSEATAQDQHLIDSFQQVLISPKNDTDKANILNAISVELLLKHDLKGSIQYANQALSLAQNKNFIKGIATSLTNIGKVYSEQHNYTEAIKQFITASNLFIKINDKSGLAECYFSLGIVYYYLDDNPKALENLFASLKLQQETGNLLKTGKVYGYIGLTYQYQAWYSNDSSYYSISLKNLNNALQIFEKLNDNVSQARCYDNIAGVYLMKGDDDKAMKNVLIALALLNGSKEKDVLARCYVTLGVLKERQGMAILKKNNRSASDNFFTDAKQNFLAAYQIISKESPNKNFLSEILVNLGSINFNMQNYTESQFYLEEALKLSKEFGFKDIIRDSYSLYVKLDSIQGNYHCAFIHYGLYDLYKDSLSNEENTKKVVQTQLQYESEEKEHQIKLLTKESQLQQAELQKQNTTRNALIGACTLMALLAGITFNRNRIKQKANTEIEKTLSHLKSTQDQLVEQEKLASLGKFTADVAKQIEVPVRKINEQIKLNRAFINTLKIPNTILESSIAEELKIGLDHIYNYGKDADGMVKKVLTETRKIQS